MKELKRLCRHRWPERAASLLWKCADEAQTGQERFRASRRGERQRELRTPGILQTDRPELEKGSPCRKGLRLQPSGFPTRKRSRTGPLSSVAFKESGASRPPKRDTDTSFAGAATARRRLAPAQLPGGRLISREIASSKATATRRPLALPHPTRSRFVSGGNGPLPPDPDRLLEERLGEPDDAPAPPRPARRLRSWRPVVNLAEPASAEGVAVEMADRLHAVAEVLPEAREVRSAGETPGHRPRPRSHPVHSGDLRTLRILFH